MRLNVLSNSYPVNHSLKFQLKLAGSFALFVFLFLIIFQPFQISFLEESITVVAAGFALITFVTMLVLNGIVPLFFYRYFDETNWTVTRELLYTLLNIWLIGILNFLYYNFFFTNSFTWSSLWWFQFSTVVIGIFPVAFIVYYKERNSRLKYIGEADSLSQVLKTELQREVKTKDTVILPSQNQNENIKIATDLLYFVKAADNYIEVYLMNETLQKKMIRNTLKSIEESLIGNSNFFRCHKSYIVNLDKVSKISGNAQGYKLHMVDMDQQIPVSRQLNLEIKERFLKLQQK